jgi:hypothetical protein
MSGDEQQDDARELTEDEIAEQKGEALPAREAMSVISITPDHPPVHDISFIEPPPPAE